MQRAAPNRGRKPAQLKHKSQTTRDVKPPAENDSKQEQVPESHEVIYQQALTLYRRGRYHDSAETLRPLVERKRSAEGGFLPVAEAKSLMARALGNSGRLVEAEKWCHEALEMEKMNPEHHFLLAVLAQEQGHEEKTRNALLKTLYLEPSHIMAHFTLAMMHTRQGEKRESEKSLSNVVSLLQDKDPQEEIPASEGLTAEQLLHIVQSMK